MTARDAWHLARDFWATSLGTLASRVLGLVRDMATAALLGLGEGGVMDALVVAFRVPNLLRRIFGEGALAASFLPVFSRAVRDRTPPRLATAQRAVGVAGGRARRRSWSWARSSARRSGGAAATIGRTASLG